MSLVLRIITSECFTLKICSCFTLTSSTPAMITDLPCRHRVRFSPALSQEENPHRNKTPSAQTPVVCRAHQSDVGRLEISHNFFMPVPLRRSTSPQGPRALAQVFSPVALAHWSSRQCPACRCQKPSLTSPDQNLSFTHHWCDARLFVSLAEGGRGNEGGLKGGREGEEGRDLLIVSEHAYEEKHRAPSAPVIIGQ